MLDPAARASIGERFKVVLMRPFEEIIVEHGAAVLRTCRAMVGDAEADDAWSDTFLAALRAYPELRPDSNVRSWLITIAHHKVIDRVRTVARQAVPTAALPDRAMAVGGDPTVLDDSLRDALASLAPKQRAAVTYRYLADMSYADVAALLGTNEAAARRSAADGIANLRKVYPRRIS